MHWHQVLRFFKSCFSTLDHTVSLGNIPKSHSPHLKLIACLQKIHFYNGKVSHWSLYELTHYEKKLKDEWNKKARNLEGLKSWRRRWRRARK
ncbi:unnamed protein product [Blepharisma stoltei]|uniref:Uncharacterized protein n=1 Tax=Blepharisma stoltei TaxID=1481888 RepID=A0AAU9JFH5_9CILI|nr:unnamed protein product [Blepharisma stoltei]